MKKPGRPPNCGYVYVGVSHAPPVARNPSELSLPVHSATLPAMSSAPYGSRRTVSLVDRQQRGAEFARLPSGSPGMKSPHGTVVKACWAHDAVARRFLPLKDGGQLFAADAA